MQRLNNPVGSFTTGLPRTAGLLFSTPSDTRSLGLALLWAKGEGAGQSGVGRVEGEVIPVQAINGRQPLAGVGTDGVHPVYGFRRRCGIEAEGTFQQQSPVFGANREVIALDGGQRAHGAFVGIRRVGNAVFLEADLCPCPLQGGEVLCGLVCHSVTLPRRMAPSSPTIH